MCVILDTNQLSIVLAADTTKDAVQLRLHKMINAGDTVLNWGGKLKSEYLKIKRLRAAYASMTRAGTLKLHSEKDVAEETKSLLTNTNVKSDDHHVLALARVSCVRILVSRDANLIRDFKNTDLISPKGKVIEKNVVETVFRKAKCR